MDRLASCYFCGTAMDDTLREYRVVPAELRGGDDVTTATLCPPCHDKLERLLAPVVGAAGGNGVTLDAREPRRQSADSRPDDARSGIAGPAGEEGDGDGGSEGHGDTDPDLVDVDGPLAGEDGETVRITHTGGDEETGDGADDEDEDATASAAESESEGDGENDGEGSAESEGDTGSEEPEPARTTVSALEYNKVMRLLQNRELPVDRAEIQAVAANAYGLAESECAEVIDLAIDRGLIAERDGQLVRPG